MNTDLYILAYQKEDVFIVVRVYVDNHALASQSQKSLN